MANSPMLNAEPLAKKLLRKWFWTYVLSLLVAPTWYFIRIIVSNDIPVHDVGLIYSIISFVLLISIYNDLGLSESLQYYLPKYRIERAYSKYKTLLFTTLLFQFLSGICIGAALRFGADRLALHYFHSPHAVDVLHIFVIYFFAINIFQLLSSIYVAFQDIIREKIIDCVRMYTVLGGTIFLRTTHTLTIYSFASIWLIALWVALILSFCYFLYRYRSTLSQWSFSLTREDLSTWLWYAFRVFLAANAATLLGQLDMQMTIAFLGPESAGYYTNYLSLTNVYLIAIGPVLSLIFPLSTELITKNETNKLVLFIHMLYKYFSVGAFLLAGILIVFWPDISSLLFWANYRLSGVMVSYTAAFMIFPLLQLFNYGIMAGMWKVKERMRIIARWVGITLCVNLSLLMGTDLGIYGIMIGTVVGQITMMMLSTKVIRNAYHFWYNWKFVLKNACIIWVLSSIAYITKDIVFVASNGLVDTRVINIGIIFCYFLCFFSVLCLCNRSEIRLLRNEVRKYGVSNWK